MIATEQVVRDPPDHLQRHVRQEEALDRDGMAVCRVQDMIQEPPRPVRADQAKKIAHCGGLGIEKLTLDFRVEKAAATSKEF
jgi:hypothetical protein